MTMDNFGDRMKAYEQMEAGRRFLPLLPVCARLDGRSFHRFTKGLQRPYDQRFTALMCQTTIFLAAETQANLGYTQSDEISLVWYRADHGGQIFFDGRIQKMTSVLAAMATAYFNKYLTQYLPEKAESLPVFDCRVWQVPTLEEAANVFVWRELDATKNSISMAARHYYTHHELHGKTSAEMQEMLWQQGVNWNDYPAFFKRGTYVQKQIVTRQFTAEELEALPAKHDARKHPDLTVERTEIRRLDLPPLAKVVNRVGVIFAGAQPEVKQE